MEITIMKILLGTAVVIVGIIYILYQYKRNKIKAISSKAFIIEDLESLIAGAIWAKDFVIDMAADILSWINSKLETLLNNGAKEANVVRGDALADFIKQNQATGKYPEISSSDLNTMNNSVIIVAMNGNEIVDNQMIRSNGGLSYSAKSQFNGQPILKIKIAA